MVLPEWPKAGAIAVGQPQLFRRGPYTGTGVRRGRRPAVPPAGAGEGRSRRAGSDDVRRGAAARPRRQPARRAGGVRRRATRTGRRWCRARSCWRRSASATTSSKRRSPRGPRRRRCWRRSGSFRETANRERTARRCEHANVVVAGGRGDWWRRCAARCPRSRAAAAPPRRRLSGRRFARASTTCASTSIRPSTAESSATSGRGLRAARGRRAADARQRPLHRSRAADAAGRSGRAELGAPSRGLRPPIPARACS